MRRFFNWQIRPAQLAPRLILMQTVIPVPFYYRPSNAGINSDQTRENRDKHASRCLSLKNHKWHAHYKLTPWMMRLVQFFHPLLCHMGIDLGRG